MHTSLHALYLVRYHPIGHRLLNLRVPRCEALPLSDTVSPHNQKSGSADVVAAQERASETDASSVGSGSLTLRDENDSSLSMDTRDMSQEYFEKCRTIM